MAEVNARGSKGRMKIRYDRNTKMVEFKARDKVLMLRPIKVNKLQSAYVGPFEVMRCIGEVDYIVKIPNSVKEQCICHIN